MKKIKLLLTISTLGAATIATPILLTSCGEITNNQNNSTNTEKPNNTGNYYLLTEYRNIPNFAKNWAIKSTLNKVQFESVFDWNIKNNAGTFMQDIYTHIYFLNNDEVDSFKNMPRTYDSKFLTTEEYLEGKQKDPITGISYPLPIYRAEILSWSITMDGNN